MTHPNHQQIIDALTADPADLIDWAAKSLIALGAKSEWDMEDNFNTTEGLVALAPGYGLPPAGNQSDEALRFYGKAALALGYPADLSDMDPRECPTCQGTGVADRDGNDDTCPECGGEGTVDDEDDEG